MTMPAQHDTDGNGTRRQVAVQTPIAAVRQQLSNMGAQFRAALPEHIPVDRFSRVVMTAVQNTPELLECDQRSLWNAAMKAAQDGLLPDGREGAITVRKDWKKGTKVALWQPMIGGIRKKARNSGEIATWDAHVVFANDIFEYELGDDPSIRHKPALTNRGHIIAAYSVCTLKSGEKTREIMSIEQMHEVRDRYSDGWKAFKAGLIKSTPWSTSEEEMCRKTVARRHSKVLPMSSDLDALFRRDDQRHDDDEAAAPRMITATPAERLKIDLDALAAGGNGNDDPPHDPETGEVIDHLDDGTPIVGKEFVPTMQNDPTGEEAARKLKERLDERAASGISNEGANPEERMGMILDEGRAAATNGVAAFDKWWKRLGSPDAARITKENHSAMRKAASDADARGA
jgi:recombination protein RecT